MEESVPTTEVVFSSSLLVSGLLGLNLLYALSAIITERKQARGADVTWSAG